MPATSTHSVLTYTPRTEDTIRAHIIYSVCHVVSKSNAVCDPGKNASDYWKTESTWLSRAQDMAEHLRNTYPSAKASKAECRPLYKKALSKFCDLMFEKITAK